jgi:alcohol dehydrogenase
MDELRGLRNAELADIARLAGAAAAPSETLTGQAGLLTRQLIERVGLRTTLPAFGVSADQLPALVQDALGVTRLAKAFPIQPPGAAYQRIVQRAYDGHLAGPAG